jgi:hypothetical protein
MDAAHTKTSRRPARLIKAGDEIFIFGVAFDVMLAVTFPQHKTVSFFCKGRRMPINVGCRYLVDVPMYPFKPDWK